MRKAMVPLAGWPLIVTTARRFIGVERIREVVLVVHDDDRASLTTGEAAGGLSELSITAVVAGGADRTDSVRQGIAALSEEVDTVLVHAAARPFVTINEINAVLDALEAGEDAAFPAVKIASTIKRLSSDARVATTVDRSDLVEAATPQGAKRSLLTDALSRSGDGPPTDEMQALESIGLHPQAVEGDSMNFKITTSDDLALARRLLGEGT